MTVRILQGDCRDVLKTLPDESVHCVVTSPPYWGLRDYGIAGQIGLEPTMLEHVAVLVSVFAEVRRVLRSDGTVWVNYGDAYAGSWGAQSRGDPSPELSTLSGGQIYAASKGTHTGSAKRTPGLKPKDLMGLPWRIAFALQEAGWWLRQDIIWHKPNPMPESIVDRCTKSHEYLFLLAKSERYYYDQDAIKEPASNNTHERQSRAALDHKSAPDTRKNGIRKIKMPDGWDTGAGGHGSFHRNGREKGKTRKLAEAGSGTKNNESFDDAMAVMPDTRNKRSVWTIATEAFPEAHFATFPPDLIEPCILAGCPEGGIVLDPFGGAGTTGLVADRHHRHAILIELNPEYVEMARKRIFNDAPLFAEVS